MGRYRVQLENRDLQSETPLGNRAGNPLPVVHRSQAQKDQQSLLTEGECAPEDDDPTAASNDAF